MAQNQDGRISAGNERGAGGQRNEGEGNRTAAREYNAATERFAKSGRVAESGAEARDAIEDGAEKAELERAERIGKSKLREEDPAVERKR